MRRSLRSDRRRPPGVQFLRQLAHAFGLLRGEISFLPRIRLQVVELGRGTGAVARIGHDELEPAVDDPAVFEAARGRRDIGDVVRVLLAVGGGAAGDGLGVGEI